MQTGEDSDWSSSKRWEYKNEVKSHIKRSEKDNKHYSGNE